MVWYNWLDSSSTWQNWSVVFKPCKLAIYVRLRHVRAVLTSRHIRWCMQQWHSLVHPTYDREEDLRVHPRMFVASWTTQCRTPHEGIHYLRDTRARYCSLLPRTPPDSTQTINSSSTPFLHIVWMISTSTQAKNTVPRFYVYYLPVLVLCDYLVIKPPSTVSRVALGLA